jgi:O-antigen ligase
MLSKRNAAGSIEKFDSTRKEEKLSVLGGIIIFLLCLVPIFSAIAYGAVYSWTLGINIFLVSLIAVFWFAEAWRKREFQFNTNTLQIPLLALLLIGLIQLLPLRDLNISEGLLSIPAAGTLSLAPYLTRFAVIQLIVYCVFFAAALAFISTCKRLQIIVLIIIVFGALMSFFGILQSFIAGETIYGLEISAQAFSFASFINRHHFAAFMEMTIGLTLGLLFGGATKKDKWIFLIAAAVVMGISIIFTGSRGGIISLLGVVGFVIALSFLKRSEDAENPSGKFYRNFAIIGSGLTLILVFFGAAILLGGEQSLMRGVGMQSSGDITNGRLHFWSVGLKIFFDYPILGAGLDAFGTAFPRYDTWNGMYRVEQAHNDYLQILADAGILGFVCVAAFIFLLFRQSLKIIRTTSDKFRRGAAIGALAGCFGMLLHSFVDFPLRTPSNAFFFLILTVVATVPISSEYRRKRSASE